MKEECEGVIQLLKDKLVLLKFVGVVFFDNICILFICEFVFLNNFLVEVINIKIVNVLQLGVGEKEVI